MPCCQKEQGEAFSIAASLLFMYHEKAIMPPPTTKITTPTLMHTAMKLMGNISFPNGYPEAVKSVGDAKN